MQKLPDQLHSMLKFFEHSRPFPHCGAESKRALEVGLHPRSIVLLQRVFAAD